MNKIREHAARWFSEQMLVKLLENEHKGGWEHESPWWLLNRLKEEVEELEDAMYKAVPGEVDPAEVIREAADVGNFAMMIADIVRREMELKHEFNHDLAKQVEEDMRWRRGGNEA